MTKNPSAWAAFWEWVGGYSKPFEIVGGVWFFVTLISGLAGYPTLALVMGTIAGTLFCVGLIGQVAISRAQPFRTLGDLQLNPSVIRERPSAKENHKGHQSAKTITRTADPQAANAVEIGYLECHVWDEYAERHLQGATVIAQNEHTRRDYSGVTNRDGRLALNVPCGYYAVTIKAERHKPRTDAVRVVSPDQKGFLDVSVQMDDDGRWLHNFNARKNALEELGELSKEGSALLKEAHSNPNAEVQENIRNWEAKAAERVSRLFGSAEETLFLSDSPLEIYHILSASAAHRAILDRVNTRVIRLNRLIDKVNADVDKMMPW